MAKIANTGSCPVLFPKQGLLLRPGEEAEFSAADMKQLEAHPVIQAAFKTGSLKKGGLSAAEPEPTPEPGAKKEPAS